MYACTCVRDTWRVVICLVVCVRGECVRGKEKGRKGEGEKERGEVEDEVGMGREGRVE